VPLRGRYGVQDWRYANFSGRGVPSVTLSDSGAFIPPLDADTRHRVEQYLADVRTGANCFPQLGQLMSFTATFMINAFHCKVLA
jgi:hypothetical protein